jgi:hypothetical protein
LLNLQALKHRHEFVMFNHGAFINFASPHPAWLPTNAQVNTGLSPAEGTSTR